MKKLLGNSTVLVTYTWKHVNHDPSDITEAIKERMHPDVLHWIAKHVEDHHMDWKAIKNVLRLDENNLDEASFFYIFY